MHRRETAASEGACAARRRPLHAHSLSAGRSARRRRSSSSSSCGNEGSRCTRPHACCLSRTAAVQCAGGFINSNGMSSTKLHVGDPAEQASRRAPQHGVLCHCQPRRQRGETPPSGEGPERCECSCTTGRQTSVCMHDSAQLTCHAGEYGVDVLEDQAGDDHPGATLEQRPLHPELRHATAPQLATLEAQAPPACTCTRPGAVVKGRVPLGRKLAAAVAAAAAAEMPQLQPIPAALPSGGFSGEPRASTTSLVYSTLELL